MTCLIVNHLRLSLHSQCNILLTNSRYSLVLSNICLSLAVTDGRVTQSRRPLIKSLLTAYHCLPGSGVTRGPDHLSDLVFTKKISFIMLYICPEQVCNKCEFLLSSCLPSLSPNILTQSPSLPAFIHLYHFRQMVARTVLDTFRIVGDNSEDIVAVFQVVLRLSQDVGEWLSGGFWSI